MLELYCYCNTTAKLTCPSYIHAQKILKADVKKKKNSFYVSQLWERTLARLPKKPHLAVAFKIKICSPPTPKKREDRSLLLLHAALLFSFVFTEM